MGMRRTLFIGLTSGVAMGLALFIVGAVAARIVYGPQFAPEGKFEPEQLNAWYFIWTKLLIGMFFGLLFTFIYARLPLARRTRGVLGGLGWGFGLWVVVWLWGIPHPLIYGGLNTPDQLFWSVYSLGGFLAYGGALGCGYRKYATAQM